MSQSPYSPERIADRMQIQDVLYRWCRAAERRDFDEIPKFFHEDAVDDHGTTSGDIPGLVAWMREQHKPITYMMLQLSNILIEFADKDLALVETTVCSIQRCLPSGQSSVQQLTGGLSGPEGVSQDIFGSSRYVDRFERREDGVWRIKHRTLVIGWRNVRDVDPNGPRMAPGWKVQQRDKTDFIFAERAALGLPEWNGMNV